MGAPSAPPVTLVYRGSTSFAGSVCFMGGVILRQHPGSPPEVLAAFYRWMYASLMLAMLTDAARRAREAGATS